MATVLMCHMKNFLLTTFKELKPNEIYKINMKKKGNEHNPPVYQYLMKQCQIMGVRCQLLIHVLQEIRRNENAINALKQKVLDMHTHWHTTHCGIVTPYGNLDLGQHWSN